MFFVRIYWSVRQYSYVTTVGMGMVTFKDIQDQVGNDNIAWVANFVDSIRALKCFCSRLLWALLFTKSGMFVNPARVSPDVLISDFGHLKIKKLLSMAVCLMTSIVTNCAIISDGLTGGPENKKTVHKISLAPYIRIFSMTQLCGAKYCTLTISLAQFRQRVWLSQQNPRLSQLQFFPLQACC